MLISLNWIRDYVDLPANLDPRELAEKFTRTTAEVDEVRHLDVGARGLIAARINKVTDLPGSQNLKRVELDTGKGKTIETITAAPVIHTNLNVVYAPPGASINAFGKIVKAEVAGQKSVGMILPGEAIGIAMAIQEAIFLGDEIQPGEALPAEWFDDWLIEVDNKSITHRPDLWGHYGMAREIAAIMQLPLKPYPVADLEELKIDSLPAIGIHIADPMACPRYSGIKIEGVSTQPAPLWMQLRLGHVGLRPITGLVDLTNYIMVELGQPMHAFDAAQVDQIEVDWAKDGEIFKTLDGMERKLTSDMLMIQCKGRCVALAGVMGGLETEVSESTSTLLLESANFESATIRKTATRLGLRTDASARFEKSLDPAHTVLAIQRFVELAKPMYKKLKLISSLSDGYPKPIESIVIEVNPQHVKRTIGQEVSLNEATSILNPIGFGVSGGDTLWKVHVPTFRAAKDIVIEADVIEEIARYIGYDSLSSAMPQISMRKFELHKQHELENRTLAYFTGSHDFHEIQGYLWYQSSWIDQLGYNPGTCLELANPAADGLHRLRHSLMPGILAAVEKNRFYFPAISLIELGSVFDPNNKNEHEFRHTALIRAKRGKKVEDELFSQLQGAIEGWAWERFGRSAVFIQTDADPNRPWEHPNQTANVVIDSAHAGKISTVPVSLRKKMDEHLGAWGIAWAELYLNSLESLKPITERLGSIPEYPLVEMDFSFVVSKTDRYRDVISKLTTFQHPLLKHIRYVSRFEGEAVGPDHRSLTIRTVIGDNQRTLIDEDASQFRSAMESHIHKIGYRIR